MTLLEATSTLIDAVRSHGLDEQPAVRRALKRMEQRLDVLQHRQSKALLRRRQIAYAMLKALTKGHCRVCRFDIAYGDFLHNPHCQYDGRGFLRFYRCANCGEVLVRELTGPPIVEAELASPP